MTDRGVNPSPLRGLHALFIPQLDAHLGLSGGNTRSEIPNDIEAREELEANGSFELVTPPAMAPTNDWFHFCDECSLMWLSGHEGPIVVAKHPSHTAIRDKRTLVTWLGVKKTSNSAPSEYGGFVYFGQDSKYNSTLSAPSPEAALLSATQHCFTVVRTHVLESRGHMIEKSVNTNSNKFLERARGFRLVIVVSDPSLAEFFSGLGDRFIWKPLAGTYRTRYGEWARPAARLQSYESLRSLELELERLAAHGIMVKWYLVHPSVNRAIASSAATSKPIRVDTAHAKPLDLPAEPQVENCAGDTAINRSAQSECDVNMDQSRDNSYPDKIQPIDENCFEKPGSLVPSTGTQIMNKTMAVAAGEERGNEMDMGTVESVAVGSPRATFSTHRPEKHEDMVNGDVITGGKSESPLGDAGLTSKKPLTQIAAESSGNPTATADSDLAHGQGTSHAITHGDEDSLANLASVPSIVTTSESDSHRAEDGLADGQKISHDPIGADGSNTIIISMSPFSIGDDST
ncbi:hypothetical protein BJ170DRAFT_693091 [Xylariales sp. AK1849]|nr:hypothetical protein BJ170DRAFT_693091 [Xylariales sp. AK1849]